MKFCLTLAAVALLGAVSHHAHAQQPWLQDRQYGEGMGVRVGDLEFHPGISGEVGYDSNYYLRAPSEDPIAVYRFRVTPSASLATLGPQRRGTGAGTPVAPTLTFRTDFYVALNALVAADSKHSSEVSNQAVNADVGYNLLLNLYPASRAGGDIYFNYVRAIQPSNNTDAENAFNRDTLRYGAGVSWRPGGGLFDWRVGYEGTYNYFEKTNFSYLNNYTNAANMRGRWRFLPRTALLYDGSYTWLTYPHADGTAQNNGQVLRTRIGLNGLVTSRFSALAMIGWAGTFYDNKSPEGPQQFDSLTAQAELKWFISAPQETLNAGSTPVGLSYASLGYTRDVQNSYLGNFYQKDRGYVGISYLLGGAFIANLNAGISNLSFPRSNFANGDVQHAAFSMQRFDANLFTEYRLSNSFGLNATVNYDQNLTDVKIPTDETNHGPNGPRDDLAWSRWQVFLGARYFL